MEARSEEREEREPAEQSEQAEQPELVGEREHAEPEQGEREQPELGERVDVDRARELVASSEVSVIDIREPDDFADVHIPGARPADGVDAEALAEEVGDEEKALVVCDDGKRSAEFAAELRERGVEAASIDGGMERWTKHQLPSQPSVDPRKEPEGPPTLPGTGN
jgi:rhodanese-related sulfurtransferase